VIPFAALVLAICTTWADGTAQAGVRMLLLP
jgi:hypothetical protein